MERLNAELAVYEYVLSTGFEAGFGGDLGVGEVMPKRSPIVEVVAGAGDFAGVEEVKSPNESSTSKLEAIFCALGLGGGGGLVFGTGAGLLSKKPPPLPNVEDETEGCRLETVGDVRLEKTAGFGACCTCGAGVDVFDEKFKLLKASLRPPKDDCEGDWRGGDARPPNEIDAV